jgi:hypothetical protein
VIFDPTVIMIFDPTIATIFDPAVTMIFDPAFINKFDHAVIKVIRPSRQDSSTPAEPKTSSSARHTSTPRSRRFDDFSDRKNNLILNCKNFRQECPNDMRPPPLEILGVTPGENVKAKSSSTMSRLLSLLSVCF